MFSLMTLLAGCGIKGPIYLPDEKQKKAALEKKKAQSQAATPTVTFTATPTTTQDNKD